MNPDQMSPPSALPKGGAGRKPSNLPGDAGFWVFIAADMCLFAMLFVVFLTARSENVGQFEFARKAMAPSLGLVSTLVLITSSYLAARAVVAARARDSELVVRNLCLAIGVGSLFAVIKAFDYGSKFAAGIGPATNDFYTYYFALTGLHLLHYLVGMTALTISVRRARTGPVGAAFTRWIESVGVYWHMVDVIWIFLFPMFYLLGAA